MEIPSSPSPEPGESGSTPLTFEELRMIVLPVNLASPSSPVEKLLSRRAPLKISIKAIYEIVIGVVTGKLLSNKNICSAMLEALCSCIEYCCGNVLPEDGLYQEKMMKSFRTLAPMLSACVETPVHGPWILRMLTTFYRKEGLVPDSIVHDLLRVLKAPSMRLMPQLQENITASLHVLQPYKPDQIPASFRRQVGRFPEYRTQFHIPSPKRHVYPESDFPAPMFQSRKASLGRYTPAALTDPANFRTLWEKMKVPDSIRNLLTDPVVQYHWIITPNDKGCLDEKRLTNAITELFMPSLSDDADDAMMGVDVSCEILDVKAAETAFKICRQLQETILEPIRMVTSCAVRFIDDSDCPDELFFLSIQNISLFALCRDDEAFKLVHETIREVYSGTNDFERKIEILDALHRMVFDFESYLHRLWILEAVSAHDQLMRVDQAFGLFKQEEIVCLAADVDVTRTLHLFIHCFDDIILNIALKEDLERDQSVRLWGSILRIVQVLVDISTSSEQPEGRHTVYFPHFNILKTGLYHVTPYVSNSVKYVTERYLDIMEKVNRKSNKTRELREIFSKWRKRN